MTVDASDHPAFEYLPDFETAGRVLRELTQGSGDAPGDADPAFPALDGYMLERTLGSGASGAVYLGRRVGGDARVAVKVFHQRLGGGAGSRRVWRELDLLAQTRVPCLPRLIDSFEHEGRPCLVTEFIDGHPLGDACEAMRLSDRERVALLADVCRATHQLHERGIIHRDLKPSNVLVTDSRDVFIIDLGIARLLEHDAFATLTHEGAPIGSPAFMSPEQASGESERVSTRSDVYALGAIG